jgi:hypothetical protein
MIEKLHDHMTAELGQSSRTDTIFVVVAVAFNLIVLASNTAIAGMAASNRDSTTRSAGPDMILAVFVVMTLLVNAVALGGLIGGMRTRLKLLDGLSRMYADHGIDKYYDGGLKTNYGVRYTLFGAIILILAGTAIIVPLIIRLVV